jgi:hypothetical protein
VSTAFSASDDETIQAQPIEIDQERTGGVLITYLRGAVLSNDGIARAAAARRVKTGEPWGQSSRRERSSAASRLTVPPTGKHAAVPAAAMRASLLDDARRSRQRS